MALDAFRAPGGRMQGTATQAMLNASFPPRAGQRHRQLPPAETL